MDVSTNSATESCTPQASRSSLSDEQTSRPTHFPTTNPLTPSSNQQCIIKPITFKVHDDRTGPLRAFLHIPQNHHASTENASTQNAPPNTAALLLSGADGGTLGPSSLYPSLASKIANPPTNILAMRLDYRYPANHKYCIPDLLAAMTYLESRFAISRFVLVGWSFGGSLVSIVGGSDKRVVGCAMIASQLAETMTGVGSMAPRPLLLVHGTGDRIMRSSGSEELWEEYGEGGERRLVLLEGDDHGLSGSVGEVGEMIWGFVGRCAGVGGGDVGEGVVREEGVGDGNGNEVLKDRVEVEMEDLR